MLKAFLILLPYSHSFIFGVRKIIFRSTVQIALEFDPCRQRRHTCYEIELSLQGFDKVHMSFRIHQVLCLLRLDCDSLLNSFEVIPP